MQEKPHERVTIERYGIAEGKQALAVAMQAWPESERAGHWQAIRRLVESGQEERVVLLAALSQGELVAAALGQVLPGKSATLWLPQLVNPNDAGTRLVSLLVDQLVTEFAASGAVLVQALSPVGDERTATLLRAGGFTYGADLLYLFAPVDAFPPAKPDLPIVMQPFRLGEEERLARVIERTYVGSLDCPVIDGLRHSADVIAGYKDADPFHPELWHFATTPEGDMGCLVVNLHPSVGHAEIVYLGIVPEARGRGFGRYLVQYAQWLAKERGTTGLVLAVDASNDPAISAYAATGFMECDRRSLWVKALPRDATR